MPFALVQVATAGLLLYLIVPGVTAIPCCTPGVIAGDHVKYAYITETYSSTDPSLQTKPQYIKDIDNTAFFRLDILTVSAVYNVTGKMTRSFNNGTADKVVTFWENVSAGAGNTSSLGYQPLVGMDRSSSLFNTAGSPAFNSSDTLLYAGASRTVNHLTTRIATGGNSSSTSLTYDKLTGVVVELVFSSSSVSGSSQQYTTHASRDISATETNLWSPTSNIPGPSPLVFYAILAAVVAAVAIVAVVLVLRRRKPPALPTPQSV